MLANLSQMAEQNILPHDASAPSEFLAQDVEVKQKTFKASHPSGAPRAGEGGDGREAIKPGRAAEVLQGPHRLAGRR